MRYVVIGASAAGISGIRELRKLDKTSEIILISKDKEIYSRCILHHYLGGHRTVPQLNFAEDNFEELVDAVNKVDYLSRNGVMPKIDKSPEDAMVIEYFEQIERVKQIYNNIDTGHGRPGRYQFFFR